MANTDKDLNKEKVKTQPTVFVIGKKDKEPESVEVEEDVTNEN